MSEHSSLIVNWEVEGYEDFVTDIVELGKRIEKVPWVCDGFVQTDIAKRLGTLGIFEIETIEESAERNNA